MQVLSRTVDTFPSQEDPMGPWGPAPLPQDLFQNHVIFRQFFGKTYFAQIVNWPQGQWCNGLKGFLSWQEWGNLPTGRSRRPPLAPRIFFKIMQFSGKKRKNPFCVSKFLGSAPPWIKTPLARPKTIILDTPLGVFHEVCHPLFWAIFGLRPPYEGSKHRWAPMTKILDQPLPIVNCPQAIVLVGSSLRRRFDLIAWNMYTCTDCKEHMFLSEDRTYIGANSHWRKPQHKDRMTGFLWVMPMLTDPDSLSLIQKSACSLSPFQSRSCVFTPFTWEFKRKSTPHSILHSSQQNFELSEFRIKHAEDWDVFFP